jgi:hypothetical protein
MTPPPGPALPGDYNLNGVVDGADYVLWRKTQGTSVTAFSGADGDGNGVIDASDYGVWRAHFGQVLTPGAGTIMVATASSSPSGALAASTSSGANGASLFVSLAPTSEDGPAPRVSLNRARQATGLGDSLDLLLALDLAYAPGRGHYGNLATGDGDEAADYQSAVDGALDESCNLRELAIGWRA